MSLFVEMLDAAGTRALIMGLAGIFCTVWGAYQLYYPPQRRNRILHLVCSMTVGLLPDVLFLCTDRALDGRAHHD
jgi:hypothetical protein